MDRVVVVVLRIVVGVVIVFVFVWDFFIGKGRRIVFFVVIRVKIVDKYVLYLRINVC